MKILNIVLLAVTILFQGCRGGDIEYKVDAGKILDASVQAGAFNKPDITLVKTEKQIVTLVGYKSIPLQADSYLYVTKDGRKYFGWSGSELMYQVY